MSTVRICLGGKRVVIYSDSLSSILALENGYSKTRPNLVNQILNIYNEINSIEIILAWIPSHADIKGNEMADKLAKEGLESLLIEQFVSFESKELIEQVDVYITKKWQKMWDHSKTGKFYKAIEPSVSNKIKYTYCDRTKEVKLTRLRLGHCKLNACLYKINCHPNGLCATCGVEESIDHYLLNCTGNDISKYITAICRNLNIAVNINNILRSSIILDSIYPHLDREL